jgi:hypothetical protein
MSNDSGGGSTAVLVALIGLATTIAGGVFANWERIFPPPPDPAALIAAEPAAAGQPADTVPEPEPPAEAASQP